MIETVSRTQLLQACRILFDPAMCILSDDFLKGLEPYTLKLAYRKRAMETHPDRCKALGKSEIEMHRLFRNVASAYEILMPYAEGVKTIRIHPRPRNDVPPRPRKARPNPMKPERDHFYTGRLPLRRLKIGQFLYYSGHISWKNLIRAIVWQKQQRPLFGQIAHAWGFLSPEAIHAILHGKTYHEKFGEYALRKGYITLYQQMAVIGKQRLTQPPIGHFFIQEKIFTHYQLEKLIGTARAHNSSVRRPFR